MTPTTIPPPAPVPSASAARVDAVDPSEPASSEEVPYAAFPTLRDLAGALAARRWLIVSVALALAVAAGIASFIVTPTYSSSATFVPESRGNMPGMNPALLGLASQFGVSLGGGGTVSPQFYAELLRARELRERVLNARYLPPPGAPDSVTLLDWLEVDGRTPARRLERGLSALDERLIIDVDLRTSIVRVAFDAPDPQLARQVVQRLIEQLNTFNLTQRQSRARARREFVQGRSSAAEASLRTAEAGLRNFHERNRVWQASPGLQSEEQRLRRQVTLQEEVASSLRRELESARIEELNDTPVLTIVDAPYLPARPSAPGKAKWVITGLLLGGFATVTWVLLRHALQRLRG